MIKSLDALEHLVDGNLNEVNYYRRFANGSIEIMKDKEIIEKELKVIELLKTRGIGLIIPNNDLSEEHIDIQVFTKSLSAEELELIKEILL